MPNKPLLVVNTSPLVALVAALGDFQVLGEEVTLVVPGEVMAELEAGAERDETAKIIRSAAACTIRPRLAALPSALTGALGDGEAAVIHTALSEKIHTVAIDEPLGRPAWPERHRIARPLAGAAAARFGAFSVASHCTDEDQRHPSQR
jgi:predicted nucleic acid-binding protein